MYAFSNPKLLLHDPSFQLSLLQLLGTYFLASPIESLLMFLKFVRNNISSKYTLFDFHISCNTDFTLPFIVMFLRDSFTCVFTSKYNWSYLLFPFTMLFVFLTGVISFMLEPLAYILHLFHTYFYHMNYGLLDTSLHWHFLPYQ